MSPTISNPEKYGIEPVQTAPFVPGATSSRGSAIAYRQELANNQNNMNQTLGGGGSYKKRKKYKGGIGLTVPSFNTPGPAVSVGPQSPTGASMGANVSLTQGSANAACDKCIGPEASATAICQGAQCNPNATSLLKGGGCDGGCGGGVNNGLIPNGQSWGCLSGGAKHKRKITRKTSRKPSRKHSRNPTRKTRANKNAHKTKKHNRKTKKRSNIRPKKKTKSRR